MKNYKDIINENLKIKKMPQDKVLINIDRLTRFKYPVRKYLRVYEDLISEYLIYPKIKKQDIETMDYSILSDICGKILNYSIENNLQNDYSINQKLFDYETKIFKLNENDKHLLNNKINYAQVIKYINSNSALNLQWIKNLASEIPQKTLREKYSLLFPIEKIIITEGATEEILLPEFAKLFNYDFNKYGVKLISAGGKNQVVKLYYELIEEIKIPIYILLDKDAMENSKEILNKLRNIDKIHLLNCGEFEDLLTPEFVINTLNTELKNISTQENNTFNGEIPTTKFLENVFKTKGYHEFKKVEFAQMIKNNLKNSTQIKPEIEEVISEIKTL